MSISSVPNDSTMIAAGRQPVSIVTGVAVGLAATADSLFYNRQLGISVAVFVVAIAALVVALHRPSISRNQLLKAALLLAICLLPVVEEFNMLSAIFAVVGAASFGLIATDNLPASRIGKFGGAIVAVVLGPVHLCEDLLRLQQRLAANERTASWFSGLAVWALPICLGIVFAGLLVVANPLLEIWAGQIDFKALFANLSLPRILFWLATVAATWSVIWVRMVGNAKTKADMPAWSPPLSLEASSVVFGEAAILRCLFAFNLIFAVQTLMDVIYLWGGATLPNGMSLAAYAHRGAYALIVTALLAAAFVIIAMQPGGAGRSNPLVRRLVYFWIAQNIALVLSSILRLKLYVEVYSLSHLRLAAFIWMGLVAVGLLLIVVQIVGRRSNAWLIAANAAMTTATVYVCCFVNFAIFIASYNLDHSSHLGGSGASLDTCYMLSLGPQAIPAIDRAESKGNAVQCRPFHPGATYQNYTVPPIARNRDQLTAEHNIADWRAWSYRRAKLTNYLRSVGPTGAK